MSPQVAETGLPHREMLGRAIRETRVAQGLSLRRFGNMIGVDYRHVMNVELGKKGVTMDTLVKIAAGLGVSVSDLIDF